MAYGRGVRLPANKGGEMEIMKQKECIFVLRKVGISGMGSGCDKNKVKDWPSCHGEGESVRIGFASL